MFFDQELCLFHIKPDDQTQLFEKCMKNFIYLDASNQAF